MKKYIDADLLYTNMENKYKFAQGQQRTAYRDILDTICDMTETSISSNLEWISVRDRLPNKTGFYLCAINRHKYWNYMELSYSAKHKLFNSHDKSSTDKAVMTAIDVDFWTTVPAPDSNLNAWHKTNEDEE